MKTRLLVKTDPSIPELFVGAEGITSADNHLPSIQLMCSHLSSVLAVVSNRIVGRLKNEVLDNRTLARRFLVEINSPTMYDVICASALRSLISGAAMTFDTEDLEACRVAASEYAGFDNLIIDVHKKGWVSYKDNVFAHDLLVMRSVDQWFISLDEGSVRLNVLEVKRGSEIGKTTEFHESFSPFKKAMSGEVIAKFDSFDDIENLPLDTLDNQYIYTNAVFFSKRMRNPIVTTANVGDLTEFMLLNSADTPAQVGELYTKVLSRTNKTHTPNTSLNHTIEARLHDMLSMPSAFINFVMSSNVAAEIARVLSNSTSFRQEAHSLVAEINTLLKSANDPDEETEWSQAVREKSIGYCSVERSSSIPGKPTDDVYPTSVNDKTIRKFYSWLKRVRYSAKFRGGWALRRLAAEYGASAKTATQWMLNQGSRDEKVLGDLTEAGIRATTDQGNTVVTSRMYIIRRFCEDMYNIAKRLPEVDHKGNLIDQGTAQFKAKLYKLLVMSHVMYMAQSVLRDMLFDMSRRAKYSCTVYESSVMMLALVATLRTSCLTNSSSTLRAVTIELAQGYSSVSHKVEEMMWSSMTIEKWDAICSRFTDTGYTTSLSVNSVLNANNFQAAQSFYDAADSEYARFLKDKSTGRMSYVELAMKRRGGIIRLDSDVCLALRSTTAYAKITSGVGFEQEDIDSIYSELADALSVYMTKQNDASVIAMLDMYVNNSGLNGALVFLKMLLKAAGYDVGTLSNGELVDKLLNVIVEIFERVKRIGNLQHHDAVTEWAGFRSIPLYRLYYTATEIIAPSLSAMLEESGGIVTQRVKDHVIKACLDYTNKVRGDSSLPPINVDRISMMTKSPVTTPLFVINVMDGMDAVGDALMIIKGLPNDDKKYKTGVTMDFFRGVTSMVVSNH